MKKWIYVILGGVLFVTIAVYADNRLSYGEVCSVDGKCSTQTTNTYTASSRQIPEDVYQALLNLDALKKEQEELRGRGFELDADKKELLDKYINLTRGVMVVKFMTPDCSVCKIMTRAMKSEDNGTSFFTYLSDKKVPFYEINITEDKARSTSLTSKFGVPHPPFTFIFKNGQAAGYFDGFNTKDPERPLQRMKQIIDQLLK